MEDEEYSSVVYLNPKLNVLRPKSGGGNRKAAVQDKRRRSPVTELLSLHLVTAEISEPAMDQQQ